MPRKQSRLIMILGFALLVTVVSFQNCQSQDRFSAVHETVTGNPMTANSQNLIQTICTVLTAGHSGLTNSNCVAGVQNEDISNFFGVPNGWYNPIINLVELEEIAPVTVNQTAGTACINGISALNPNSTVVQNAYVPSQPDPFSGVAAMVQTSSNSCATVYSSTPFTSVCSAGPSWIYQNGVLSWPGDYSYEATINYSDTSGAPLSGLYDIMVSLTGTFGAWQPYYSATPYPTSGSPQIFPVTGCNFVTFAIKPTIANDSFSVYLEYGPNYTIVAGKETFPQSTHVLTNTGTYGPANLPVGSWSVYKVPYTAFFPTATTSFIINFQIEDELGSASNVFYIDNVGFTAN